MPDTCTLEEARNLAVSYERFHALCDAKEWDRVRFWARTLKEDQRKAGVSLVSDFLLDTYLTRGADA